MGKLTQSAFFVSLLEILKFGRPTAMKNSMKNYFFTSESVSEGHPDKVADQISDSILDYLLERDPKSRVACETMVSRGLVLIAGEITSKSQINFEEVARKTIQEIGYDDSNAGFDYKTCKVIVNVSQQSPDIAQGVDQGEQGAGDQGIMFGYAVDETPELMPLSLSYSHKLVRRLADLRKSGKAKFLRPDAKSQVTVEYKDGVPSRIDSIVVSTQHAEDVTLEQLREFLINDVIKAEIDPKWIDKNTKIFVNPTGRFVHGGPAADCGLTGRKIIVDTYGGHGAHGGGAFSGKDPSKVDRSAAYAARHIAKNIVAAGLAEKCLIQISYAIGVAQPLSVMVNDYGTSKYSPEKLALAVSKVWDLRPASIIREFDLLKPVYKKTAAYGHFGRDVFSWEKLNKVEVLKDVIKSV